jgi:nicotinate-nucleotide adenylyltransferase
MARIGLLGGSFNPPHICHLLLSEYVLETVDVQEVWWLPVHRHAFGKDGSLAPWDDRLAMARAAVAKRPRIKVNPIEALLAPPNYTIQTVAALRAAHPDQSFVWLAGADVLGELHLWHRWPELAQVLEFLIVGRGDLPTTPPEGRFEVRDFTLPDVSSSTVRSLLQAGDRAGARRLLPAAVARWLETRRDLYR